MTKRTAKQPPAKTTPLLAPGAWPADRVERRPLLELVPYGQNARVHSREQIRQIAELIRLYGWTSPILVDERGTILAGHGRALAAAELGLADVPVMVARGWSEAQRRAYVIADNKAALNAGWDEGLLVLELEALRGAEFDLALTGFGEHELAGLFAPMAPIEVEWGGMPEFDQQDKTAFRSLTVHFADAAAVEAFGAAIGQTIGRKARSIWFPPAAIETYADKRYTAVPDASGANTAPAPKTAPEREPGPVGPGSAGAHP